MNDGEGLRIIKGGRRAALEEMLVRIQVLCRVDGFSDAKKLEKIKEMMERELRSLE